MPKAALDYLIIGPAYPFRGGIAETQHQLALALQNKGKRVELVTFTKLYPKIIFPGKTQLSQESAPDGLIIKSLLHAYNPLKWSQVLNYIKSKSPRVVVFRYYTPFLALAYAGIAKKLPDGIKKIALVDNWIPHEKRRFDKKLNALLAKQMDAFTSLSPFVAKQIEKNFTGPVWAGFHPINRNLCTKIPQQKAKSILSWDADVAYVLFFGLIRKYKGLELLIQAFDSPELKKKNIKLYVAGECYENESKYIHLIESLELQNQIVLDFNFKNNSQIQQLFSAASLVAQTYHTATQSGVTPLAYCYEKPLLVSDIEGLRTPIEKDQTGLVVKKKPEAIAAGIIKLLEKQEYNRFEKNIKKASEKYSWKSYSDQWDEFVSNI